MHRSRHLLSIVILLGSFFLSLSSFATEFSLRSQDFANQGPLPVRYTCDGKNLSPNLSWQHIPPNTKSLTLIVSDPDAPGGIFYHWLVYNMSPATTELPEGISNFPNGTSLGTNSFGKARYDGPCPPKGEAHHYVFTLYALDTMLPIPGNAEGTIIESAMQKHILGKALVSTIYSRW